jgi:hypothetical protein
MSNKRLKQLFDKVLPSVLPHLSTKPTKIGNIAFLSVGAYSMAWDKQHQKFNVLHEDDNGFISDAGFFPSPEDVVKFVCKGIMCQKLEVSLHKGLQTCQK